MSKLYINGGNRLCGEISVHGAKNSVLPILAATILCAGECIIKNCPELSDVDASVCILEHLGCECKREEKTLVVNTKNMSRFDIPDELMREMRSSIVWLGAIAGRTGRAKLSSPGGCELGPRPIDLHISALKKLGLSISEDHGYIDCCAQNKLIGNVINLDFPSVGATENIMLASVTAIGKTIIHNAAREPEIVDLQNFLISAGAVIYGAGSDTIIIDGVDRLHGTEYSIMPDRIVAATYMASTAVTGGEVLIKNIEPQHLISVLSVFNEIGCKTIIKKSEVLFKSNKNLNRFLNVRTMVYPGFPTDAGPLLVAVSTLANGSSMFVENIFENRYKYIDELKRLGADIKVSGRVAVIEGVKLLSGAAVRATDLRGGAALVVAGLAAGGVTQIDKVCYIDRGYEKIEENLRLIGADIKRV